MPFRERPRLTWRMAAGDFQPEKGAAYIFGGGLEERSEHVESWLASRRDVVMCRVVEQGEAELTARLSDSTVTVQLRSAAQIASLLAALGDEIYLDITGLAHHIWAPLLRGAWVANKRLWAVYVEPHEYNRASAPTEGRPYDLSERIEGVKPLPGFASLGDVDEDRYLFAPLLGFEGTRLIHVVEHVQPPAESTVPVIGVPGFRAEYPFVTYRGNRKPLMDGQFWPNARYASANCPFDLFYTLRGMLVDFDKEYVRVAPIGTKPHGLGAVIFSLSSERRVEIIYDHPIRKPGRTTGSARLCLYDLSTFMRSQDFAWDAVSVSA